jgi:hypothetical protein
MQGDVKDQGYNFAAIACLQLHDMRIFFRVLMFVNNAKTWVLESKLNGCVVEVFELLPDICRGRY